MLGYNVFTYCNNVPVCFTDINGLAPQRSTAPFVVVIILDDGCGSGGDGAGGGIDPGLLLIDALIRLWESFDRLSPKTDSEDDSDAIFYTVHIEGNKWIQGTTPMSFSEAYSWVKSSAISYAFSYRSSWGLYTLNERDALEMAIALGGAVPAWDEAKSGQYRHYHVHGRSLFGKYKHFHVWYGAPIP